MKKIPFLLIIAFLLVFGVALAYGYYYSQNNVVNQQINDVETEIASVRNQLNELRDSEIVAAQNGIRALETISEDEVVWSEVLSVLLRIVPLEVEERGKLVNFTSYSGSEGGQLSFNSQTNPSTNVKRQLEAVSTIIRTFNESQVFTDAYVPSISKSVTEDEESVLSFIFNVNYIGTQLTEQEETPSVPVN
jgi:hypothetical protein